MREIERLKSVMEVQTTSGNTKMMNKFIIGEINQIGGCKVKKHKGNIYVTKGKAEIYPCIVAHTDTVHNIEKEFHIVECNGNMLSINGRMQRVGIGGDDKVGVFVALEMLRTTKVCKAAFFRDEEIGCIGSQAADMKFFKDVGMALQCDRQGYEDFVNSIFSIPLYEDSFSDAVSDILAKYGRVESDGGMTDVWQLVENGLGVAVANMSCGYYQPHSDDEYINIDEVLLTLRMVEEIVEELGDSKWSVTEEERAYTRPKYLKGFGQGKRDYTYNAYGASGHLEDEWGSYATSETDDWGNKDIQGKSRAVPVTSTHVCGNCLAENTLMYDSDIYQYYCLNCEVYINDDEIEWEYPAETETKEREEFPNWDNGHVPF